jgi:CrcB protein
VTRFLLICLGGALGTGARYLTTLLAVRWLGPDFPYGTLAVNLVGCFAIGVVHQVGAATLVLSPNARLFLATGVMGGLTTYSAFSYETVRLLEAGAWAAASANVIVTTAGCLAFCALGIALGRMLTP